MSDTSPSTAVGFAGAVPDRQSVANFVAAVGQNAVASQGGKQYLKISDKDGLWYYGADAVTTEEDSLWAINVLSLWHNYIAWDDGKVEGETPRQPMSSMLPGTGTLKPVNAQHGWQLQQGFDILCVTGEDAGTLCEFKASSVGGLRGIGKLAGELQKQVSLDPDKLMPVVLLKNDMYYDKKYKKNQYPPVFEIVEWRSLGDSSPVTPVVASSEDDETDEPETVAAPASRKRATAAAPEEAVVPRRRATK